MKKRQNIIRHMQSCLPGEGCGFILNNGKFVPCENKINDMPQIDQRIRDSLAFAIDPLVYKKHAKDLKYIVHSHISADPENDSPSNADKIARQTTAVPWVIYVFDQQGNYVRNYEF